MKCRVSQMLIKVRNDGLSSAVIDVARLVAMFSDRTNNPVLSPITLDSLFANAAAATSNFNPPYWGFHGFDTASIDDSVNHVYRASKGGLLPSHESTATFITGGFGFIIAQNGNRRPNHNDHHWFEDGLSAAAQAHTWPDVDLFVEFGMPSLAPGLIASSKMRCVQLLGEVSHVFAILDPCSSIIFLWTKPDTIFCDKTTEIRHFTAEAE